MKPRIKRAILLALLACDGMPMPESALISAVQLSLRPVSPTEGDVADCLKDVESEGYAAGVTDDIAGRSWTLTDKGTHKARKLR